MADPLWGGTTVAQRVALLSLTALGGVGERVANDNAPEYALRPAFLSTFALATDQGSKLGLSNNKSIICYYNTYQIVQFNRLPLVISFIASSSANTGLIISLEKDLAPLIEDLRQVVEVA
ncbi:mitogen-activated protein kinase scaffold protein 1-like [Scleropages formosus]|uniref:Mitogen-activated protein kinase scaffold protein 1-like n=1 Tax=Scleropages formosus TaxID=113540 RepID=A0A0P7Z7I4_SCLFO|nr:mitogen-activated protein kinase scaffold protein 1-like [Scleropages formosus]